MARRKVSNPLALAALALLTEKPMHPYEMSTTLRERSKEESIKLNYGSLYSVIQSLQRHKLIDVHETVKDGKRPERTVYSITEAGRAELIDWLSELISTPVKEFTQFEAGLSLIGVLHPDEALDLLRQRRNRLDVLITGWDTVTEKIKETHALAEILLIEHDYTRALRAAELEFVDALIEKIEKGTLGGIEGWRQVNETGVVTVDLGWLATRPPTGRAD
ncbi:DNA-binding PadR family transcriptional regulator [Herbihabitans rhizosphaerae]|uniref:DNA-binding PadR family transcriptional regulator n=1 Tax=Herbihabitans rhizosphaerae TaxID=1872711 RepID=A0A4Q7KS57_9PSEU|nr:PadR family transcriptional regulator [Herbihabitans rhizosphaerae]RZS38930.1 DNA-binding PadR family transcriptional regulator [Herbihabitans rhizosphaerae]